MTALFLHAFLPLSLLAGVGSFSYALATGADLELAVVVPAVAVLLLSMLAERWRPYRAEWARARSNLGIDLASTTVLFALVDPVLKWQGPWLHALHYGQHANLPLRNGWLNYVFSMDEVHQWHHSSKPGEGGSNFGRSIVLWDQVFGTFRYQPGRNDSAEIGSYAGSRYPARAAFMAQVRSMFLPACCRATA